MNNLRKHLVTKINFLTENQGGRKFVFSGYRGQFHYDGHGWDSIEYFDSDEPLTTGREILTYIFLASPDSHKGNLYPGKQFEIREGSKLIGQGEILEVLIS